MKTKQEVRSVPCPTVGMVKDGQAAVVNQADQAQWEAQGWKVGQLKAPAPQDARGDAGKPEGDKTQTGAGSGEGGQAGGQGGAETPKATEAALALMKANAVDPSLVKGTGKDGAITKPDVEAYLAANG